MEKFETMTVNDLRSILGTFQDDAEVAIFDGADWHAVLQIHGTLRVPNPGRLEKAVVIEIGQKWPDD